MIKKTLTTFAASIMLLPVGFITASPASATPCNFYLKAPDNTLSEGPVTVTIVSWIYSGSSVKPSNVTFLNRTGRQITVTTDRWEDSVTGLVNRGVVGNYDNGEADSWNPPTFFPVTNHPFVVISAYATSRPGMHGDLKIHAGACTSIAQ
jgi:hypothetical protein